MADEKDVVAWRLSNLEERLKGVEKKLEGVENEVQKVHTDILLRDTNRYKAGALFLLSGIGLFMGVFWRKFLDLIGF